MAAEHSEVKAAEEGSRTEGNEDNEDVGSATSPRRPHGQSGRMSSSLP